MLRHLIHKNLELLRVHQHIASRRLWTGIRSGLQHPGMQGHHRGRQSHELGIYRTSGLFEQESHSGDRTPSDPGEQNNGGRHSQSAS